MRQVRRGTVSARQEDDGLTAGACPHPRAGAPTTRGRPWTACNCPTRCSPTPGFTLADQLKLPTFEANGPRRHRRLAFALRGATIEDLFYPLFPPDTHAGKVAQRL